MSESVKLTPKLHKREYEGVTYYIFWCLGCECGHVYSTGKPTLWQFNGNIDNPTFTPSLLNTCDYGDGVKYRCHLFVTDGKINYCGDCTHPLAGQIVDMADIPKDYGT